MIIYVAGPVPRRERPDLSAIYDRIISAAVDAQSGEVIDIRAPGPEEKLEQASDHDFHDILTRRIERADAVIAYMAEGYAGPPAEAMYALTLDVPTLVFAESGMRLSRFVTGAPDCSVGELNDLTSAVRVFVQNLGRRRRPRRGR